MKTKILTKVTFVNVTQGGAEAIAPLVRVMHHLAATMATAWRMEKTAVTSVNATMVGKGIFATRVHANPHRATMVHALKMKEMILVSASGVIVWLVGVDMIAALVPVTHSLAAAMGNVMKLKTLPMAIRVNVILVGAKTIAALVHVSHYLVVTMAAVRKLQTLATATGVTALMTGEDPSAMYILANCYVATKGPVMIPLQTPSVTVTWVGKENFVMRVCIIFA